MRAAADIGNLCLWITAIAIVTWIIQYTWLTRGRNFRNIIGVSLVGFAVVTLAIYVLAILSLADPSDYSRFAGTHAYRWLATVILFSSSVFIITRIVAWEQMRRRGHATRSRAAARIAELEAENQLLRERCP